VNSFVARKRDELAERRAVRVPMGYLVPVVVILVVDVMVFVVMTAIVHRIFVITLILVIHLIISVAIIVVHLFIVVFTL
jgi:hypothetical protein